MPLQRPLPLGDQARLDTLWDRLPERCRSEFIALYAQRIVDLSQEKTRPVRKERPRETSTR
jgi:hypothetical protein